MANRIKPIATKAKINVAKEATPNTRVLTAEAIRCTIALSDRTGLEAKVRAIEEVNKYSPQASDPAMPDPTKQRNGVGGTLTGVSGSDFSGSCGEGLMGVGARKTVKK
jgi:hypothetical protein